MLILCGCHDCQFAPACSEQLADGIEGAELVWFERSGHYPYLGGARSVLDSGRAVPVPPGVDARRLRLIDD